MGDGPGYDYAHQRAISHAARKKETQKERSKKLHDVLSSIGFGDCDGDLNLLEKKAAEHLRLAYELFSMLSRD